MSSSSSFSARMPSSSSFPPRIPSTSSFPPRIPSTSSFSPIISASHLDYPACPASHLEYPARPATHLDSSTSSFSLSRLISWRSARRSSSSSAICFSSYCSWPIAFCGRRQRQRASVAVSARREGAEHHQRTDDAGQENQIKRQPVERRNLRAPTIILNILTYFDFHYHLPLTADLIGFTLTSFSANLWKFFFLQSV